MKTIPHLHDFVSGLPGHVQAEMERLSSVRPVRRGQHVYRMGEPPRELYRLLEGAIKICNYSLDGGEIITGEFRPGDCFGEMGLIDGLPRVSHAIASKDSQLRVLGKRDFTALCDRHPEINQQLTLMLCRRLRLLYTLNDDATGFKLHVRLARLVHRLAYSHGQRDGQDETYIEISHDELSKMLGASRQSVSKELKSLEREGDIELRYGKIYLSDLERLRDKYEKAVGKEQVTALYDDVDQQA